jgi:predicted permease
MFARGCRRVWYLLNRRRLERELDREMESHRAQMADPRGFGHTIRLRERSADVWGWTWVDDLRRDIRHGARLLLKSPGFTSVATIALAVGIGANVTIFGFVNALLLRPLPVDDPARLVRADLGGANVFDNAVPFDDYVEYRDRNQTLTQLSLFHPGGLPAVRRPKQAPEPIHVMPVTGNYFDTLGLRAALGRTFSSSDDQPSAGAVVLSQDGWRRHFDADPNIIGQTLLINEVPFLVVGIAPASFTGTMPPVIPRIYATWRAVHSTLPDSPRGFMIGRLAEGRSVGIAQADFARIAAQLTRERNRPTSVVVYPATVAVPGVQRTFAVFGALFMVIVGLVLWGACSNIAILNLVRSAARRREMEIRLAVGATRVELLRQLLTENLLLATLAGAIGIAMAVSVAGWLTQMPLPVPMPLALTFGLDWRVMVFACALSLIATLMSGLGPALDTRRANEALVLRHDNGAGGRPVVQRSLVVMQVVLSTVLLVTALALVRSVAAPQERRLDATRVLVATVALPRPRYGANEVELFYERLLASAESARIVESAALVETIPLAINRPLTSVDISRDNDAPDASPQRALPRALVNHVSRGLFATVGIRLLEGRDFRAQDDARAPKVAIVNETLARRFWRGESPVGQQLRIGSTEWVTIVGVAQDSKYESLNEGPKAHLYLPFGQSAAPQFDATLLLKTNGDPRQAVGPTRSLVADLDPTLVVFNLNTLEDRLRLSLLPNRAIAVTSGVLGLLASLLGIIGTYSVMAFLAFQRRREIGIRIALGALPTSLIGRFVGQGMRWISVGLGIGALVSVGALRLLQLRVVGVSATDLASVGTVLVVLAATGFAACYVPTSSVCRRSPTAVLRE